MRSKRPDSSTSLRSLGLPEKHPAVQRAPSTDESDHAGSKGMASRPAPIATAAQHGRRALLVSEGAVERRALSPRRRVVRHCLALSASLRFTSPGELRAPPAPP